MSRVCSDHAREPRRGPWGCWVSVGIVPTSSGPDQPHSGLWDAFWGGDSHTGTLSLLLYADPIFPWPGHQWGCHMPQGCWTRLLPDPQHAVLWSSQAISQLKWSSLCSRRWVGVIGSGGVPGLCCLRPQPSLTAGSLGSPNPSVYISGHPPALPCLS